MKSADRHTRFLLIALATAIAPQIFLLPAWILAWVFLLWGYAWLAERKGWRLPGKYFRAILAFLGVAGVLLHFRGRLGGGAYVGLLAIMSGLKVLEVDDHRGRMITVFLAYFLVVTSLFQVETLSMTVYMFFSVAVTTAVLVHINHPAGRFFDQFKLSGSIMLKAVPIMAALFFLFPRIQGSFWGMAKGVSGQTGISDEIYPGSMSSLVENDEIAFRATFEGGIPSRELLYWRGVVLWEFDGFGWKRGIVVSPQNEPVGGRGAVEYTVMLEPHHKRMLFALDMPVKAPPESSIVEDHTIVSDRRIRSLYRYRAVSHLAYESQEPNRRVWASLRLPRRGNPRSRDMARQWARESSSDRQVVETALAYLRNNEFAYTLRPPLLYDNPVDRFLFDSKKGYCEHFASSFAFLMRAAGVPARVVGGYQGGEKNPYMDYLIVRQSDAHAWVEVWLENRGSIRVDPTAQVAPERIASGLQGAVNADELPDYLTLKNLGPMASAWKNLRYSWDAVNSFWDIWFVGYSHLEQRGFLALLGFETGSWRESAKAVAILAAFIAACVAVAFFAYRRRASGMSDPVAAAYARFCSKMAAQGIPRRPGQGPLDFADAVAEKRSDLKGPVQDITELYVRLRYAPVSRREEKEQLKRLKKRVAGFSPRRPAHRDANLEA